MLETEIISALGPLVAGRVWPTIAPLGSATPFIVFQQVGGQSVTTLCGNATPLNARIQFNIWSNDPEITTTIMLSVEAILTEPPFRGVSQGAFVADYSEVATMYGARQDFSFWR
jgi:hypothetical protein